MDFFAALAKTFEPFAFKLTATERSLSRTSAHSFYSCHRRFNSNPLAKIHREHAAYVSLDLLARRGAPALEQLLVRFAGGIGDEMPRVSPFVDQRFGKTPAVSRCVRCFQSLRRAIRGLDPVQRLKARENAAGSENPTR